MGIDGLIILESTGRSIIQSGFRCASAAYPMLHIDVFNNAASHSATPGDIDPVLYVPSYDARNSPSACCHVGYGGMRFLCPISGDVDPLSAFAFLQTFIDILHEYFGTVSAPTLKENFDVVYQLLEETLDSGGHPLTTSPNALRDIVLPPSLLTKLLNVAGANLTSTLNSSGGFGSTGGPFASPIPWRKANLRYASNEIYFDMVEELKAIINKHGTSLSSNVWGKIETNAKLSGTPDLVLSFTNSHVLVDCAFHPCVRLQRWARDRSLSFIPPDGRFVIMDYRFNPSASSAARAATNQAVAVAKDNVHVPFTLKTSVELEEHGGTFDLVLTSRLSTHTMQNYRLEIHLGQGAGGIKCTTSRGSGGGFGRGSGMEAASVSGGWSFDPKRKVIQWEIPAIPPSSTWSLRGSFTSPSTPRPSHAFQIRFEIPSHTYSALKVEQLRITGETYKPYKGVRGRSVGNIEWRW